MLLPLDMADFCSPSSSFSVEALFSLLVTKPSPSGLAALMIEETREALTAVIGESSVECMI